MVDEQDSSIFNSGFKWTKFNFYQLHESASDHNVRRQLFCLHGHCDKYFRGTYDPHSNTVTRSFHVAWGGEANVAFSAPKICQTNILRHIHPSTIYPCKDKINLIDTSKQAKMQGIQDPSRSNVDNLNNVRRDARN